MALNKSITRLLCGESPESGSVWIAWLRGEVSAQVKVPQPWSKNWHKAFGENRFAGGNLHTVQDTHFGGKGCGNRGQVKCQHVSKQSLIL